MSDTEPIAVAIQRLHLLGVSEELAAPPTQVSTREIADEGRPDASAVKPLPPSSVLARTRTGPEPSPWTLEAVRRLGMTTDVPTAGEILGIGRTLAFDLVRTGRFPVRFLRLGARIVVPVPELLKLLGATESAPTP